MRDPTALFAAADEAARALRAWLPVARVEPTTPIVRILQALMRLETVLDQHREAALKEETTCSAP